MSDLEKILVAIAAAMIVGAIGYAAGREDWHVIKGSEIISEIIMLINTHTFLCKNQTGTS